MRILFESALTINQQIKKLINKDSINSFSETDYQGDNANYCTSLFHDYLINPNESTKMFLYHLGKSLIEWIDKKLSNGYFKMEDVHHGTEVFLGFLPRYIDLFPGEEKAKNLIINLANFIGNWKKETGGWYNYSKNNFNSWCLGTDGISNNPSYKYNTADHLRFVHITLLAWKFTKDEKYLEWSLGYSKEFAKKINQAKHIIPVAWDCDWNEFFSKDMKGSKEQFLAANQHHFKDDPLSGTENLVASGSIYIFGFLYQITKDEIFLRASKKIISNLFPIITKPQSDNVGTIISYYRNTFSDYSFDGEILNLLNIIPSYDESEIMLAFPENQKIRKKGVGYRKDMIYWFNFDLSKSNESTEPPTSFFSLVYNITGEIKYAERALVTAARKIKIASSLLRSGFEHSDSGKLLSSVISGHGRNWGVGPITGCYSKLIIGSNENLGMSDYLIKYLSPTITRGCLPIIRELPNKTSELLIYNFSNKKNLIKFLYKNNNESFLEVQPNSTLKKILKN
ncbi:hypothetical protein PQZ42_00045 [Alphaproteobacteria bacterium]|nr:hypothetical protein [Alphaproteobacteria bacterium]